MPWPRASRTARDAAVKALRARDASVPFAAQRSVRLSELGETLAGALAALDGDEDSTSGRN